MSNFNCEVAITKHSDVFATGDGPMPIAQFNANSVIEFTRWINSALEYFGAMVKFEADVKHVAILVRIYRDHHVVSIFTDENGKLVIRSNQ